MNDIVFFKADGAYSQITLKNKQTLTTSKDLKHFEDILSNAEQFFRCHKSYNINTNYVIEYIKSDRGSLLMDGDYNVGSSVDKSKRMGQ